MKIFNVTPGLLPIPPNGWGAVEKIIWEMHLMYEKLGHQSLIGYLNDIPKDVDVVHIHVANLANEAYVKGIKYYFTMHDHHAFLYGKDSHAYKENLQAIKNAEKAFVPAKFLVDYFEGIPQYFSHGVNTEFFTPIIPVKPLKHRLLCVANNGYIHDQSNDRKGFEFAIKAAEKLGLPITIAGPKNNKVYFAKNPISYSNVNAIFDLNENELREVYNSHTIFIHASELEAGHPNLTILEAMASGLPVVGTLEDGNELNGLRKTVRDTLLLSNDIQYVIDNYDEISILARQQAQKLSWKNRCLKLIDIYNNKTNMKEKLIEHYTHTPILAKPSKEHLPSFNFNNIDGMFAEILSDVTEKYKVRFINTNTNETIYSVDMNNNCWAQTSIKYYVDWKAEVENVSTGQTFQYRYDLKEKNVYIALDSKSIGDTIAWFPYVDEFRKKHSCNVICSTFHNDWFKSEYPNIKFIEPGQTADNILAMYTIGIFYKNDNTINNDMHPNNPITQPLQKVASDILGLKYRETKPKIKKIGRIINLKPYVAIGFNSTAQSKYWNNPTGWQEVVDYINSKGYEAIILSKEEDGYMGNNFPKGATIIYPDTIDQAMEYINGSQFFIGISSGLSWLAWALEKKTVLISGFTEENLEFNDCIRIINKSVCNGCWSRHRFDPGNWNWCPEHEKTERQFECTKKITGNDVILRIKNLFI